MRCPKCGFISFDHLKECLKCKKNIAAKLDIMQGAVLNISAPAFLALQTDDEGETVKEKEVFADQVGAGEEYLDKDLEILTMDDAPEVVEEIELADGATEEIEIQSGLAETEYSEEMAEESDGEIEIDLSLFEQATDPEGTILAETATEDVVSSAEPDIAIDDPRVLAGLSDPVTPASKDADTASGVLAVAEEPDSPEMALDDLDFDLGLDDLDDNLAAGPGEAAEPETMLVLDDFDFSDTKGEDETYTGDSEDQMEMDGDLNFDLDLGGLSMHEEL